MPMKAYIPDKFFEPLADVRFRLKPYVCFRSKEEREVTPWNHLLLIDELLFQGKDEQYKLREGQYILLGNRLTNAPVLLQGLFPLRHVINAA